MFTCSSKGRRLLCLGTTAAAVGQPYEGGRSGVEQTGTSKTNDPTAACACAPDIALRVAGAAHFDL